MVIEEHKPMTDAEAEKFRSDALAAMTPEEVTVAAAKQVAAQSAMEAVPLGAAARVAARRALPRPVSTTPPLCNRCGRTFSQREMRHPVGWSPGPQVFGEELTEDEVPICCGRSAEMGSPEDVAYREIECLKWGIKTGWKPLPDPVPDPTCKFCKRLRGGDGGCQRDVTTGSADDRQARALECSMIAAMEA